MRRWQRMKFRTLPLVSLSFLQGSMEWSDEVQVSRVLDEGAAESCATSRDPPTPPTWLERGSLPGQFCGGSTIPYGDFCS